MSRLREYDGRSVMTIEYNGRYIGSFSLFHERMHITTGDDTWDNSIIGYKVDDNKLNILLKRYFHQREDDYYIIKYFEIEFTEIDNKIVYTINEINSIDLTGYYINDDISIIYPETVRLMREPSFYSESYGTIDFNDYGRIKLLAIGDTRESREEIFMNDFWYKIEYEGHEFEYWVYGHNVYFSSSIGIR